MKRTVISPPDCNRCDRKGCDPTFVVNRIRYLKKNFICKGHVQPRSGWPLVELALAHPTGLNEALSNLPFQINLNLYLR